MRGLPRALAVLAISVAALIATIPPSLYAIKFGKKFMKGLIIGTLLGRGHSPHLVGAGGLGGGAGGFVAGPGFVGAASGPSIAVAPMALPLGVAASNPIAFGLQPAVNAFGAGGGGFGGVQGVLPFGNVQGFGQL